MFDSFYQADLVVGRAARPAGVGRISTAMLHFEEVADRVVDVALYVRAHGVAVARMRRSDARGPVIGMRNRRAAHLCQLLAERVFDQPVDGFIGVIGARPEALVAE